MHRAKFNMAKEKNFMCVGTTVGTGHSRTSTPPATNNKQNIQSSNKVIHSVTDRENVIVRTNNHPSASRKTRSSPPPKWSSAEADRNKCDRGRSRLLKAFFSVVSFSKWEELTLGKRKEVIFHRGPAKRDTVAQYKRDKRTANAANGNLRISIQKKNQRTRALRPTLLMYTNTFMYIYLVISPTYSWKLWIQRKGNQNN